MVMLISLLLSRLDEALISSTLSVGVLYAMMSTGVFMPEFSERLCEGLYPWLGPLTNF